MKTLISSNGIDFIIDETYTAIKDMEGGIVYTSLEESIAKVKGKVFGIDFFYAPDNNKNKYTKVTVTANQIKELHKAILEIEAKESEEFWD